VAQEGPMHTLMFPLYGAFLVVALAIFAVKIWALVDCLIRPERAFALSGKRTKTFWTVVTVLAVLSGFLGFLSIIGLVAAIVYLVDVRPRVKEIPRGGGNQTHMGPYGPW
jgi:hypothetical protein